jgi:hypothetical protein
MERFFRMHKGYWIYIDSNGVETINENSVGVIMQKTANRILKVK